MRVRSSAESPELMRARELFGDEVARYLENKHRGGGNNARGGDYENAFACFQLIKCIHAALVDGVAVNISTQVYAFVDDLQVLWEQQGLRESYQLKSGCSVSWTNGQHPIVDDFSYQKRWDEENQVTTRTVLVVSDANLCRALCDSMPEHIAAHSRCDLFEDESISILLQRNSEVKQALQQICIYEDIDKLASLHTTLLGVWCQYKRSLTEVSDFIGCIPDEMSVFLRRAIPDFSLEQELADALDGVKDMSFHVVERSFSYSYTAGGFLFEGFMDVDSEAFVQFSNRVVAEKPRSFRELWELGVL